MYVNLGNETDTAPEVSEFKCTVQKLAKVQVIVKIIHPNSYTVQDVEKFPVFIMCLIILTKIFLLDPCYDFKS